MRKRSNSSQHGRGRVRLAAFVRQRARRLAGEVDPQEFSTQSSADDICPILSDCASCHTVPQKNRPFAGGRPIETPFGNIVAPNITPDMETGIGAWTDDQFDAAVRKGIGRNGARLYPAMPYNAYTKMSRADVLAIRAYLNTLPAVYNPVVANTLPFPFNIRICHEGLGRALLQGRRIQARSATSLQNGIAARFWSTAPRIAAPAIRRSRFSAATRRRSTCRVATFRDGPPPTSRMTCRRGLGGWSVEDIAAYLKTGHNRITAATGPMAEAVDLSTSKMTDDDVKAIGTYLKSLPGRADDLKPLAPDVPEMVAGGAIFSGPVFVLPWSSTARGSSGCSRRSPIHRWHVPTTRPRPSESCCAAPVAWRRAASRPHRACRHTHGN